MNGTFIRLSKRILDELDKIDLCFQRAIKAWLNFQDSDNELFLDSVALNFQGTYNGIETIFELIAKEIDEVSFRGENWHQLLLNQMTIEVTGKRPAVISVESCQSLNNLRSFRHVIRHVYPFDLDAARIEQLLESAQPTLALIRSEVSAFAVFLQSVNESQ